MSFEDYRKDTKELEELISLNKKIKDEEAKERLSTSIASGSTIVVGDGKGMLNKVGTAVNEYGTDAVRSLDSLMSSAGDWFITRNMDEQTKQNYMNLRANQEALKGYVGSDNKIQASGTFGETIGGFAVGGSVDFGAKSISKIASKVALKKESEALVNASLKKARDIIVGKQNTIGNKIVTGIEKSLPYIGINVANAVPYGFRDVETFETGTEGVKGHIDNKSSSLLKAIGAETIGNALLPSIIGSASYSWNKYKTSKLLQERFNDKQYAKLNSNSGIGFIVNNLDNKAIKDNAYKINKDGFFIVDNTNDFISYSNKIDSGALINKEDGSFTIKTPNLGEIKGKIIDGEYIIDLSQSKLTDKAKRLIDTKNNKYLIDTDIKQNISKQKQIEQTPPTDSKRYGTFSSIKVDDKGEFKKIDGTSTIKDLNSNELNKINKEFRWAKEVGLKDEPNSEFKNKTIIQQAIVSNNIKTDNLPQNIKYLKEKMNKVDIKTANIYKELREGTKEHTENKKIYDALYKKVTPDTLTDNEEITKYNGVKDEVLNAIKAGYVDYVAKTHNPDHLNNSNMVTSVTATAQKILGDVEGINQEFLRRELQNIVKQILPEVEKTKDGSKVKVKDLYDINNNGIKQPIDYKIIDDVLKSFDKPKPSKIIVGNDINTKSIKELVENNYGVTGRKLEVAVEMAKTPYTLNENFLEIASKIKNKAKSFLRQETDDNIPILRYVEPNIGNLNKKELKAWWNSLGIEEQKAYKDAIKNFLDELDYLENLYNENPNSILHFKTKVNILERVYYDNLINPQTKLGRFIFNQKEQKINLKKLTDEEHEIIKRSFLQFFGFKPEKMNIKEVNKKIDELADLIYKTKDPIEELDNYAKDNYDYSVIFEEKAVANIIIKNFKQYYDYLQGKNDGINFTAITEIDGINNGIALTKAMLGLKDESLGIGSLSNTKDIYETFVNNLNIKGLSRSDVKTAVIAVFNGATDFETSKAVIKQLIGKIRTEPNINERKKILSLFNEKNNKFKKELKIKLINVIKNNSDIPENRKDKIANLIVGYLQKIDINNINSPKELNDFIESILNGENERYNRILLKIVNKIVKKDSSDEYKNKKARDIAKSFEKELKDYIEFLYFQKYIESSTKDKKSISIDDNIFDKFVGKHAYEILDNVKTAISKTLGKEIMTYRKILNNFSKYIHYVFSKKYLEKNLNGEKIRQWIKNYKDLFNLTNEEVTILQSKFKIGSKDNKYFYSVKDFVDALVQIGKINEKIMSTEPMQKILPKIPTPFGDAHLITFKGYAGYDRTKKLNAGSPTPIFIMQPLFTMNMDSAIMAYAYNKGMTSLWDAGIGSPKSIIEFAKTANKGVIQLINSENITKDLAQYLHQIKNELDIDKNLKENIANYIAEQSLRSRNKQITKYSIVKEKEKVIDKLDNSDANFVTILNDLKVLDEIITENKKQWKDGKDYVAQYSDGGDYTKIKYSKNIKPIKVERKNKKAFIKTAFNIDLLKNIKPLSNDEYIEKFKTSFSKNNNVRFKNPEFVISDINAYKNNVIYTNVFTKEPNSDSFKILIHEIGHHIINKIRQGNNEFGNKLEKLFDVLIQKGLLLDNNKKQILKTADTEEQLMYILQNLIMNQLIEDNSRAFAKLFKTTDLSNIHKNNILYFDETKIENLKQLRDYIKTTFDEKFSYDLIQELNKIVDNIYSTLNSNEKIKAWINKLEDDDLLTTINNTKLENVINYFESKIEKNVEDLANNFKYASYFELLSMNQEKENLLYALSLKIGFENQLIQESYELNNRIKNHIESYGIKDLDRTSGEIIANGLHIFLDIFKKYDIKTSVNKIKTLINNEYLKLYKWAKDNNVLDDFIELEKKISNLAYGDNVSLSQVKSQIKNIIGNSNKLEQLDELTNMFLDYTEKRALWYKISGKFKNLNKENNLVEVRKIEQVQGFIYSTIKKIYKNKIEYDNFFEAMNDLVNTHLKFKNNTTLYGINPFIDMSNSRLVLVKKKKFKGNKDDIVGFGYVNGKKYIVTLKDNVKYKLGEQESDIINFNPKKEMSGIYKAKIDNKNTKITLNPTALNYNSYPVDVSLSTMVQRNHYYKQYKTLGKKFGIQMYNILKKAGILITREEYDILGDNIRQYYKQLPDNNPLSKIGGKLYYKTKYEHNIIGSPGANYKKGFETLFGKRFGSILADVIKLTVDLTQALKTTVLVGHISSYINSSVANTIILANHIPEKNIIKYRKKAKVELKKLKRLIKNNIAKLEKGEKINYSELENNILYKAFMHGISQSMRTDAINLGTIQESVLVQRINKAFGNKYTDTRFGEVMKTALLDQTTPIGKKLGEWFDETELIPKFALYLYALDQYNNNKQLAVKKVLMAFPTYQNIHPVLAGLNEFTPFLKYTLNIPKMMRYAMNQKTNKTLIYNFLTPMLVHNIGWDDDELKKYKWYYENGFSNISDNILYYSHNLFPFNYPIDFDLDDKTVLDNLFVYNVLTNAGFVYDINPIKIVDN